MDKANKISIGKQIGKEKPVKERPYRLRADQVNAGNSQCHIIYIYRCYISVNLANGSKIHRTRSWQRCARLFQPLSVRPMLAKSCLVKRANKNNSGSGIRTRGCPGPCSLRAGDVNPYTKPDIMEFKGLDLI